MNLIKKVLGTVFKKTKNRLEDSIEIKDEITIHLIRDGKVIKTWKEKGHSLQGEGQLKIRDALVTGGFTKINYMNLICTEGTFETATTNTGLITPYRAQFVATFPEAGARTTITQFGILQTTGGSRICLVEPASFTKPDGVSLEVTWVTTPS